MGYVNDTWIRGEGRRFWSMNNKNQFKKHFDLEYNSFVHITYRMEELIRMRNKKRIQSTSELFETTFTCTNHNFLPVYEDTKGEALSEIGKTSLSDGLLPRFNCHNRSNLHRSARSFNPADPQDLLVISLIAVNLIQIDDKNILGPSLVQCHNLQLQFPNSYSLCAD